MNSESFESASLTNRWHVWQNPIQVNNVRFSQLVPRRLNMFDANHAAPYSRRIKILDRHFRAQSESKGPADDVIFYGYLPWGFFAFRDTAWNFWWQLKYKLYVWRLMTRRNEILISLRSQNRFPFLFSRNICHRFQEKVWFSTATANGFLKATRFRV